MHISSIVFAPLLRNVAGDMFMSEALGTPSDRRRPVAASTATRAVMKLAALEFAATAAWSAVNDISATGKYK